MESRQSERGLALLRIFSGIMILRETFAHLAFSPWPWTTPQWVLQHADLLAGHSLQHPMPLVRNMIRQIMLPYAEACSGLGVIIGLVAGVSLCLGLFSVPGALLGLGLAALQGLLAYYKSDAALAAALTQTVLLAVLASTRSGRTWGLDALLSRGRPRSWLY
ncbi:MAG: hypothetical protein OEZ59_04480 [Deltaproteobacteria bacterium]|nr:hypothetical protein [Deltaproteobacteria bacterium]